MIAIKKQLPKLFLLAVSLLFSLSLFLISAEWYLSQKFKYPFLDQDLAPEEASRLSLLYNEYPMTKNFSGYVHDAGSPLEPFFAQTNSWGLREKEFSEEKHNQVRILVFGDSITFGYGVPDEYTFPKELDKELNENGNKTSRIEFEVLNFGVSGYNTHDEWLLLQSMGLKINPDMVLLMIAANDHEYREEISHNNPLLESIRKNISKESRFYLFKWLRYSLLRMEYINYYRKLKKNSEYLIRITNPLMKIIGLLQKNNIEFIAILIANGDPNCGELDRSDYDTIARLLDKHRVSYVDLDRDGFYRKFASSECSIIYLPDGHLNKKGNKELAKWITSFLKKNYFLQ
ncbi:SGNH/GDSL hydrolase family protein [Candidatus Omnitrophota bacterium]